MGIARVISASLSPNTEGDDVLRAFGMFLTPWRWQRGGSLAKVTRWFAEYLGNGDRPFFFNSGRSALLVILKSFGIGEGDEVIVQAFTCVAVPNGVLWAGATPVYADIDGTYNSAPRSVEKCVSRKTKAIIVQHTFGVPADMDSLLVIAKKHNLLLIEDCAHALGSRCNDTPLGTLGDAAFFSFGRDKSLSSVWGGAAVIRARHKKAVDALSRYHERVPQPNAGWIAQQLLHPILFALILPMYRLGIGKLLLFLLQRMRLLSFPVFATEKTGGKPLLFPAKYPEALAYLLIGQLKKLTRYTKMRQSIASYYAESLATLPGITLPKLTNGSAPLRYTIEVTNPEHMRSNAKKHGVLLGNWYNNIIDPRGVAFISIGYKKGSCPVAESAASRVVNLPTLISGKDASAVVSLIRKLR